MSNNKNNQTQNQSELNLARAAKKAAGDTFCGIAKSLYVYAETEEGAYLKGFMPKDKAAFLKRGTEVCAWGHVGEKKETRRGGYVIKISGDIILRFINKERKEAEEKTRKEQAAKAKAAKEAKKAKAKAAKEAKKAKAEAKAAAK